VPFPFVETPKIRERPALVVSRGIVDGRPPLLWVCMITSAANRGWNHDISLEARHGECGLAVPCVIRMAKIATIEAGMARKVGALPADLLDVVLAALSQMTGRSS